jgi:PAS domain S-box-containing protein
MNGGTAGGVAGQTAEDLQAQELAALRLENELFSSQVKGLVKAEGKLYQYQEQLDAQLREYQELYQLNLKLGATLELSTIFGHGADFIVDHLGYERVLFLQFREQAGDYAVCALNGYYDPQEKDALGELAVPQEAPVLSPLFAGSGYLIHHPSRQTPELAALGEQLKLSEYLLYPLGSHAHPVALMAVGNSAANPDFYRRVGDGDLLLGIGNLAGLLSSCIENQILYTGMKKALEQEKVAENKYRGIFENALEGIFQTTPQGRFISCNPATAETLGYDTAQELMTSVSHVEQLYVHPEMREVVLAALASGQQMKNLEVEFYRKDGSKRWVRLSARPVLGETGELLYVDGSMEDISERKEAEKAIQKLNEELEQRVVERTEELEGANAELRLVSRELEAACGDLKATQSRMLQQEKMASIGQLAAGVAHEINNPMGFVISNLNTLGKYAGKLSGFLDLQSKAIEELSVQGGSEVVQALQEQKRALKIGYLLEDLDSLIAECQDGAQRVKKIVQELKSFSRMDESEFKSADLNEGLENTINIVWNELKFKAELRKEYGKIPAIMCNPGQLNQVFINLLMNAVQAIESRGQIGVKTSSDQGFVYVEISDSGSGIPADKLNRIFEPFYTTKEVGKGTGLGLSIVYDIVKKHKGEIQVASEPGKGTVFTMILPIDAAGAEPKPS